MAIHSVSSDAANFYYNPLPIPVFERVLHGHSAIDVRFAFGMKRNGRIRQLLVECHRGGGHIERLQVQPGVGLETLQNRFLHLFFAFDIRSAGGKQDDKHQRGGSRA